MPAEALQASRQARGNHRERVCNSGDRPLARSSFGRSGHASVKPPTPPSPRNVVGLAEGRVVSSSRKGLTIPKAALDLKGVRPVVVQLDSGRLKQVEVALGLEDAVTELVEVTKGLAPGDTIILGSSRGLPEGTPARVQVTAERTTASTAR